MWCQVRLEKFNKISMGNNRIKISIKKRFHRLKSNLAVKKLNLVHDNSNCLWPNLYIYILIENSYIVTKLGRNLQKL